MSNAAISLVMAEIEGIPRLDDALFTYVHTENSQCGGTNSRCKTEETYENSTEFCENDCETENTSRSTVNNDHEHVMAALTIIDHYKAVVDNQTSQLAAKDEQIQKLTDLVATAQETAAEQITAARASASEQLAAKDTQIQRLQDTIDALTRQLEEAHEPQKKWWQWWKR